MGGAVSAGADNDELVDNLLEADYIKTASIERIFRAVDRGHYFTVEYKETAYRDIAWKCGNLHISAPCIYSKAMENLKLAPGLSFLNLGSGTGYLSTLAGLILGPYGINHGIEIHEDVLNYATKKLEEFVATSSAIDEYDFCEPKFVCGNCLNLGSSVRQYDRVYCSGACPENHENYMKNLIKVGGILVIPIKDQLLQICRTSETSWETKFVLPVSFASLVPSKTSDCQEPLLMPDTDPLSLQDICRFVVRSILRRNIDLEHPDLKKPKPPRVPRKKAKKRNLRRKVIPIFHSNSEDEEDITTTAQANRFILEWSRILQGPSEPGELRKTTESTSHNSSIFPNQQEDESTTEQHSNFAFDLENSSDNILEEMSGDEILSDFEELHNILTMSETSTSSVTSGSESENGKQKSAGEVKRLTQEENKAKNKFKQKKLDSGIIEDIGEGGSGSEAIKKPKSEKVRNSSENIYPFLKVTDSDTDTDSFEYASKEKVDKKREEAPNNVVNYTTYMKEKIRLLPLPMTLKYFLNLNRDL